MEGQFGDRGTEVAFVGIAGSRDRSGRVRLCVIGEIPGAAAIARHWDIEHIDAIDPGGPYSEWHNEARGIASLVDHVALDWMTAQLEVPF